MKPADLVTIVVNSGEWDERQHPRDEDGKFTESGGMGNRVRPEWSTAPGTTVHVLKGMGGGGDILGTVSLSGSGSWLATDRNGSVLSSHPSIEAAKTVVEAVSRLDEEPGGGASRIG